MIIKNEMYSISNTKVINVNYDYSYELKKNVRLKIHLNLACSEIDKSKYLLTPTIEINGEDRIVLKMKMINTLNIFDESISVDDNFLDVCMPLIYEDIRAKVTNLTKLFGISKINLPDFEKTTQSQI
jgi:hypothetical protein